MEITSFVLGMLTIVGITLVVLVVLGIVKIYKQKEHLNQLEQTKGQNLTNPRSEAKPLRPGTFFRNGNLFLPIVRGLFIFF